MVPEWKKKQLIEEFKEEHKLEELHDNEDVKQVEVTNLEELVDEIWDII
jgi:hypothetical protein